MKLTMRTSGKPLRFSFLLIAITLAVLITTSVRSELILSIQETTPPNFKIAFIGDQYLGANPDAVMSLIKAEGAAAVIVSGDLDYTDNPATWEAQINNVLGPNFPVFVAIGNHDVAAWAGPTGYQQYIKDRFNRLGISWSGDLGVQSSFHYKGLFFVMTAPGIEGGYDNGNSDTYIRDQLAADTSAWSICSWHKNQTLMQVGGKPDETGWGVYEEARKGGAIVATAHEHSYSRTHLMNSIVNHTVANGANSFAINKGNTFAFVSGLGGNGVRPQLLGGNWWASIYTSTCLQADPVCRPNGNFGALFGTFNVDGQANKAVFYFKDVAGNTIDSFTVFSNVEAPILNSLSPAGAQPGDPPLALTLNGENFVAGSIVRWNGEDRVTTFNSSSQLTAAIPVTDLAAPTTALVTVFNPTGVGATSSVRTFSVGPSAPRLLNEANSERVLAMDSVTKAGGPFALFGNNFSPDQHRRLMLFAANLDLLPTENMSAVTAQAEDAQHNIYPLTVEFVGKIPQYDWLTQIVVKLPVQLGSSNDVWVSVSLRGATSNKALISIQH